MASWLGLARPGSELFVASTRNAHCDGSMFSQPTPRALSGLPTKNLLLALSRFPPADS